MSNLDLATVRGFGYEWKTFNQADASPEELNSIYQQYFSIFPWEKLESASAHGADFGCGSGRWAKWVSGRVGHLHLIDASSEALEVAKKNLAGETNVTFHLGSVEQAPIADEALDFAFSLGVLHHMPDTRRAMADIARKLKPGAPFLVYLYYNFDNRPAWYGKLWQVTNALRIFICRLPLPVRRSITTLIAATVYWPLARTARRLEKRGKLPEAFPLSFYRDRSFYVMKNDALDRLGTRIEQRFSRAQIGEMLETAGFRDIMFSPHAPYWCAVGFKKETHVD